MDKVILFVALISCALAISMVVIVIYIAGSVLFSVFRGKKLPVFFPEPEPPLTYKIPRVFGDYLRKRDGWKGDLPFFGQFLIFCFVAWLSLSILEFHSFDPSKLFIIFLGFGVMFYGMHLFVESYDRGISFYRSGVANRPKRRKTPYRRYAKAVIEKVVFESRTFQVITLVPKHESWLATKDEYGFNVDADLTPLIVLLKEQGLPVEERIEGAPPAKMA